MKDHRSLSKQKRLSIKFAEYKLSVKALRLLKKHFKVNQAATLTKAKTNDNLKQMLFSLWV